jgi:uncharacterized Ntn-hydrolase superfamily protein
VAGLRAGLSAQQALADSLEVDDRADLRQVGVVSASGEVAAHTGESCIPVAGHVTGDGFSAQANMMLAEGVPEAMAEAFTVSSGAPLVQRLLAALDAAEAAGGDMRGRQSAALMVSAPEPTGDPLVDLVVDVRVDDHADPLVELRRLSRLAVANHSLEVADALIAAGDTAGAAEAYREAREAAPDYTEFSFWQAASLAEAGLVDEARQAWEAIDLAGESERWARALRRTAKVGLLRPQVVQALLDE